MTDSKASEKSSTVSVGKELDPLWFHTKTGNVYKVLTADGKYENVGMDSRAVIYQSLNDHTVWIRPYSEFMDGRFVRLNTIINAHNPLTKRIEELVNKLSMYREIYGDI